MNSFQDRALDEVYKRNILAAETYNQKYDRHTLKIGLSVIFLLIITVSAMDIRTGTTPKRYVDEPRLVNIVGREWVLYPIPEGDSRPKFELWSKVMDKYSLDGYTDCENKQIFYRPDSPRPKRILWHEITHAAGCEHLGSDHLNDYWTEDYWRVPNTKADNLGHSVVYNIADFMDNFERSNPEFMEFKE